MSFHLDQIELKKGRSLFAGFSRSRRRSRQWVVFQPESNSDFKYGDREELENLVGYESERNFNFLVINKPGLYPDGLRRQEFEKSFRRKKRIDDTLQTMKRIIPSGHKIHIVGYSEGAYLAPQIARRDKRVCSVTMIGGGTRGWLKEELNTAPKRERGQYAKIVEDIMKNPKSKQRWNGFSYATWHSYRGDHTLRALRGLTVPTLCILGARDRVIDLKTTIVDLVLVSERQPIQINVFGDCGHNFTKHWEQVSRVLGSFLKEQS